MSKKLLKIFNIKKISFLIILVISFQISSFANDIRDLKIEGMSIGDSALSYFDEKQLEDGEQGWHNYGYEEFSTSLVSGKGIYDWFLVSYRSDDDNFIIEALVGGLEKTNYDNKECNKKLDNVASNMSEAFTNTRQDKKIYELKTDASRTYPFTGKSTVTSLSFNFKDEGEIILECYKIDKDVNQNDSFITTILSQKDSFRINVRSRVFINYLNNKK